MRKGTFSVQKAKPNSAAHNSRKYPPKYLIGLEENTKNYYELMQKDEDFISEAQEIYRQKIGQKMQKKQIPNLVLETVMTLKKEQDENTVKDLFKKLNQEYGGHNLLEVSIHRDEGHFVYNGFNLYPNKSIIKIDGSWHIQSDPTVDIFDVRVDESEMEKVYNYHAHAKFTMFEKSTGKTARMNKGQMSKRIKFISDELGLAYAPDKATRHTKKSVGTVKDEHNQDYLIQRKISIKASKIINSKNEFIEKLENQLSESREDNFKLDVGLSKLERELRASRQDMSRLETKNKELDEQLPRDEYGDVIKYGIDIETQKDAKNRYEVLEEKYQALEERYEALDKAYRATLDKLSPDEKRELEQGISVSR